MTREPEIGSVRELPIRKLWHRETDFTQWLARNIGNLDSILGIGLRGARPEEPVGDLRVDIVAETEGGGIAIENQLERSDHRHFGQLLTYIAHPDQEISQGIWIVESARDEHVKAVERLNEAETVRIWMVKVRAIRIGNSLPAPLFEIIVAPPEAGESSDASTTAEAVRGLKPAQIKIRDFQGALFTQAREENVQSPFYRLSPSKNQLRDTPARGQGLLYRLAVTRSGTRVVVTNRKPKNGPGTWLRAYDELRAESDQIARDFADKGLQQKLSWWDERSANGRWGVTYEVEVDLERPDTKRLRELNQAAAAMKAVFDPRIGKLEAYLEDAPLDGDPVPELAE